MSWLSQYFLNPGFVLPGAALASLPVIIHLLSRLRYKRVRFAAMEFLLQSDELNRRRLVFEQLLLLLLRVMAVVLIMFLIARLVLDPSGMLLLRGASTHHVLILDDSLSMRQQEADRSVFQKAIETLESMLSQGRGTRGAVRVSILTTTDPQRPIITDRQLDSALVQELTPVLRNQTCSWTAATPVSALRIAEELLSADEAVAPQVHVLTDLRRCDWTNQPEIQSVLRAFESIDAQINLVRVSGNVQENSALHSLTSDTAATAVGVPWRMNLTFRNYGNRVISGARAVVLVDNSPLPARVLLPDVETGGEESVAHDIVFETPGQHSIEVRLDDDSLTADNSRFLVVEVTEKRSVLIVDDQGRQEDAGYVAAALSADPELTGISCDIRTSDVLTSVPLEQYDCLYLLNVRELPADATQALSQYVRSGGGLAWFPDDQANTTWYNTHLASDTVGLFPVALSAVEAAEQMTDGKDFVTPVFENHPVFAVYLMPDSPFPETVRVSKWFGNTESSPDDAPRPSEYRTLIRLKNGQPVAFEHTLGKGRILTFLTTAGRRWTNWPVAPAAPGYVVMHLLIHQYLQQPVRNVEQRELGTPIRLQWPVSEFTDAVEVQLPADETSQLKDTFIRLQATVVDESIENSGTALSPSEQNESDKPSEPANSTNETIQGAPEAASGDHSALADTDRTQQEEALGVTISQADRPGIYRIRRFTPTGENRELWMSLSVPTTESDLSVADDTEIQQQIGSQNLQVISAERVGGLAASDAGRELRWIVLSVLIAVLILEQLMSLRLSFHPEVQK